MKAYVKSEDVARQAASVVLKFVMDDTNWRLVSFRRRPRRGAFFDCFVSRRRLARETAVLREFFCLGFAVVTRWIFRRSGDLAQPEELLGRVLELCIDGFTDPLWPVFRFTTPEEAASFVSEGVPAYVAAGPPDTMAAVLHERMSPTLDEGEQKAWIAHAVLLCAGPSSVLPALGLAMDHAVGGPITPFPQNVSVFYTRLARTLLQSVQV